MSKIVITPKAQKAVQNLIHDDDFKTIIYWLNDHRKQIARNWKRVEGDIDLRRLQGESEFLDDIVNIFTYPVEEVDTFNDTSTGSF